LRCAVRCRTPRRDVATTDAAHLAVRRATMFFVSSFLCQSRKRQKHRYGQESNDL
jgi:hypothetical protein